MKNNDVLTAKDWLEKANNDIGVAEYLFSSRKFYEDICFHCQQAAEKSLKAFLVYHREVPKKVHSLKVLLQDCLRYDSTLKEVVNYLELLDELYIPTRYPFKIKFNREQAKEAIESAKIVLEKIKTKIK